eukprot:3631069-Amphidinium_carterae.1
MSSPRPLRCCSEVMTAGCCIEMHQPRVGSYSFDNLQAAEATLQNCREAPPKDLKTKAISQNRNPQDDQTNGPEKSQGIR